MSYAMSTAPPPGCKAVGARGTWGVALEQRLFDEGACICALDVLADRSTLQVGSFRFIPNKALPTSDA
eukprot:m.303250 g.303250  ORF g.303250 m.303250 type:complete len:68 (+) comp20161_c0_seq1:1682-1885(+)